MVRKNEEVSVEAIELKTFDLKVEGVSPLLMHKFSDASKKEMVDKQVGVTKERQKRDIEQELLDCVHKTSEGKIGFPASGFKKAMAEAAPYLTDMNKKLVKGAFQILGNILPIKFKKQVVNEAVCRLSGRGNVSMVRFRPEFHDWTISLPIKYNAKKITPQQIVALANVAGFHIGVGDWRPQCSGSYGMFKVV